MGYLFELLVMVLLLCIFLGVVVFLAMISV